MDSISQQQQKQDDVMEVPDASLAAENAGQQLASLADVDGDCWIDSQAENYDIHLHGHQDCEDCCGLDGILLPDFDDEHGTTKKSSRSPYVVFGHGDDTLELEWAEMTAMDPFTSEECTGDWYMDGLVMAMEMEWEEQDGGSEFPSFEPTCYGDVGEAGAGAAAEQVYVYGSPFPLWE